MQCSAVHWDIGAIQVLRNAVGGGRVSDFPEKALRTCTVQRYWRYEGVGGCQISTKKALCNV